MKMPSQEENLEANEDVTWHKLATRICEEHSLLCCVLRAVVTMHQEQEVEKKKKGWASLFCSTHSNT